MIQDVESSMLKQDFDRDGFAVARGLIPPDEVEAIKARFEEIWFNGVPGYFERKGDTYFNNFDQNYPRVIHPHRFDASSRRY